MPSSSPARRGGPERRKEGPLEASFSGGIPADLERSTVDRARLGNQQALADLYDWYMPRVYRYVLARVGSVHEAEDLTEEIFLKMLSGIGDFRWKSVPFSAWLFRIAHNEVASHFRRRHNRNRLAPLFEGIVDDRQDLEALTEHRLTVEDVTRAAADLPEAQREVIALRFAVGLSIAETAQALGKREGNIKALQHKAVARLQKALGARIGEGKRAAS
jgi:RNA polymerase sigma-70 factor (ECF subfamily)